MRSTSVVSPYSEMRLALIHICQARKKNSAPTTACTSRCSVSTARVGSMRSMKSMVTCSSACETSGSPAKIRTSSISSVISNAPRIGRLPGEEEGDHHRPRDLERAAKGGVKKIACDDVDDRQAHQGEKERGGRDAKNRIAPPLPATLGLGHPRSLTRRARYLRSAE